MGQGNSGKGGRGRFYSEANGSKEIKEHSLHEKLPRRNIVCEVREAEMRGGRSRNTRSSSESRANEAADLLFCKPRNSKKNTNAAGDSPGGLFRGSLIEIRCGKSIRFDRIGRRLYARQKFSF